MTRRRLPFTLQQVAAIAELRPAGASWRAIGRTIGRSHVGYRRYWIRELDGAAGWARARGVNRSKLPNFGNPATVNRPPLSAGSTATWCAITSGTVIEGIEYL